MEEELPVVRRSVTVHRYLTHLVREEPENLPGAAGPQVSPIVTVCSCNTNKALMNECISGIKLNIGLLLIRRCKNGYWS